MDMLEPGKFGTTVPFKKRYGNLIGGEWVAPVDGQYFENITPVTGKAFCEVPRSTAADIDRALDAAHKAKSAWGKTSPTERANILNKVADRIQESLPMLSLIVGHLPYFGAQHREIVGNDEVELLGRPVALGFAVHHLKKMNELAAAV